MVLGVSHRAQQPFQTPSAWPACRAPPHSAAHRPSPGASLPHLGTRTAHRYAPFRYAPKRRRASKPEPQGRAPAPRQLILAHGRRARDPGRRRRDSMAEESNDAKAEVRMPLCLVSRSSTGASGLRLPDRRPSRMRETSSSSRRTIRTRWKSTTRRSTSTQRCPPTTATAPFATQGWRTTVSPSRMPVRRRAWKKPASPRQRRRPLAPPGASESAGRPYTAHRAASAAWRFAAAS